MFKSYKMLLTVAFWLCGLICLTSCGGANTGGNTVVTTDPANRIGVPECDDYLDKYAACILKMPQEARTQLEGTTEMYRESWKEMVKDPKNKPELAKGCKKALELSKNITSKYNCVW